MLIRYLWRLLVRRSLAIIRLGGDFQVILGICIGEGCIDHMIGYLLKGWGLDLI
jgi:hypothetical protein